MEQTSTRRFTVVVFLLLLSSLLFGQSATGVKGEVTDSKGAPLPGANISVVGTSTGTITQGDGAYHLKLSA
ncbi:MAG: carboxypeptidase-like regulatory domain-containing protein, partial [Bacteroidota bacterium]|nr:carboxypeptidase-like regulatory domain-containing protein [Bacteroidota bacterium]